jgi:hypothetical protein
MIAPGAWVSKEIELARYFGMTDFDRIGQSV